MKKAVTIIALLVLLPVIILPGMHCCVAQPMVQTNRIDLLRGGWVEQKDGLTILHVNGSNYQMGLQHGSLLRDQVQENIRAFLHFANQVISNETLLGMWQRMSPYVSQEYKEEMQGIADGANVSYDAIVMAITAVEYADHGCYGIAAWGPATNDHALYHSRSFDLPSLIQDPVTGKYPYENSILVVRDPADGYASLCPSIAGSFHTGGGINENGVAFGIQICWSKDQTFDGIPYHFRVQAVLDHARTTQEAIAIVNTNRTHGFNFVISQADPAAGFVVEQTANHTYVGTYNDSIESRSPFYAIDHVVRRTNVFLDPTIAATQRKRYDPTGLIGFLNLLLYKKTNNPFFAVYHLYKSVSTELTTRRGTLDLNTTMAALQNGYRAPHDPLLRLIEKLGKGTGMAEAWNQWTACPGTGEMVVSFANHTSMAYTTEVHYVNFNSLLQSPPP